ncbi:MAG: molybdenum cofactor guanylyltransferase [Flavobacteriales bacterium]|nr:Molybdenum cofactor guanylyltransferase [Flavobacteriales bacterium]MCC6577505.1 molybdenum cofactor guanylyltransferase [Flavobacteriales bacterium]NUQ14206.1 molybdenum cofactor guanylyltransferase [Flavobacteriales bacterium]
MSDRAWTGVVLTGGRSSRMGTDKALVPIDGVPMLARAIALLRPHVRELLIIGDTQHHRHPHATTVADDLPGLGPIGGLITALDRSRYGRILALACDMPGVNDRLLLRLKERFDGTVDAVVPVHEGRAEPLAAAYHRRCADPFRKAVEEGLLKLTAALDRLHWAPVDVRPGHEGWPADLFRNVNRPGDL